MKASIFDVANAFLSMGPQTPKKLQKLCYYAYAWNLAFTGEHLFDDIFEAWVHGPVNPDLYHQYQEYGWNEIPQIEQINVSPDLLDIAKNVYGAYGNYNGNELESFTHDEAPWKNARGNLDPWERCNTVLNDNDIAEYYRKVYDDAQNSNT